MAPAVLPSTPELIVFAAAVYLAYAAVACLTLQWLWMWRYAPIRLLQATPLVAFIAITLPGMAREAWWILS